MKFNINDTVWVKLTQRGRDKVEDDLRLARKTLPDCVFETPVEVNGYTEFQLWVLMSTFGGDEVFCGSELYFETEILIGEKP